MKYTEVKDAHIVPRVYLKRFTIDEALMLVIDGKLLENPVSIDSAAIRKRFYRRVRPDGTPIDDVEWSLSQLEGGIAQTLSGVRDFWPLSLRDGKGPLSEFFAMQLVRGPRWKTWLEQRVRQMMAEFRQNPEPLRRDSGLVIAVTQKTINETEDHLLSETQWLTRMMLAANKLIDVFGSMQWHLIEFDEPLLAISDHPVTAWSLEAEYRRPEPTPAGLGALNFLEVRVPLSPTLALLMTWQDSPDSPNVICGSEEIAANINAFTIANAERQWMHLPGGSVPIAEGYLDPISSQLIPHYGAPEARASTIRKKVTDLLEKKLGQSLHEAVGENGTMYAPKSCLPKSSSNSEAPELPREPPEFRRPTR